MAGFGMFGQRGQWVARCAVAICATASSVGRRVTLVRWRLLLLTTLCVLSGCSSLARRWRQDDVVSARQIAQRGMDAFHAGDWQRAEEFFAQAVEVCAVDERVRSRYSETLWNLGSRKEAIEHMQEAVRLSGGSPELMVRLGEMYLAEGDLHQAKRLADQVGHCGRDLASARRLQGDVLQCRGRWRDALAAYHRALSIQPQYPEVQMAIAQVYHRNGRPQRALSTLQTLASSYPPGEEPAELLYWHGTVYAALGRDEMALSQLALAEARGLQSADLLYQLAEARLRAGDGVAAAATLERALQLAPDHPQAARLCGLLQREHQVASLPK